MTLMHVIPPQGTDQHVTAVTSLGDDVFVARRNNQKVEVYNAETFTFQRHISVAGLHSYCYLAACAHHRCLYVSGGYYSIVHRVDLSDTRAVQPWSVASCPTWLSVNKTHNLVVMCSYARKIQTYTTHGSLVREICLQPYSEPQHAVQLSTGDFVVSYLYKWVSIVGVDGQDVHSYRRPESLAVGHMKDPRGLAVTKNDIILFADEINSRILTMNSSLSSVRALSLPVEDGAFEPSGLHLDESRARLYIGECGGQNRLLVFKCS